MKGRSKGLISHQPPLLTKKDGFTLIELAIVLVVIGIILGAVIKGQDLITGARTKKFINKVNEWDLSIFSYLDRKGRYPGDSDKDGKIGDGNVKTDLTGASFINPPFEGDSGSETNTITVGAYTFYVAHGTDGGSDAGKNVMIITTGSSSASAFSSDELVFAEALDTSIDGSASGTAGQVVSVSSISTFTLADWEAYTSSTPTPTAWGTSTTNAIVWYFDRRR